MTVFIAGAELVTISEIGRRLGVSGTRARQLVARPSFPESLGRVGAYWIWRWADVEEWASRCGRSIHHANTGGGR